MAISDNKFDPWARIHGGIPIALNPPDSGMTCLEAVIQHSNKAVQLAQDRLIRICALETALLALYNEQADYLKINNLAGITNKTMVDARRVLGLTPLPTDAPA